MNALFKKHYLHINLLLLGQIQLKSQETAPELQQNRKGQFSASETTEYPIPQGHFFFSSMKMGKAVLLKKGKRKSINN